MPNNYFQFKKFIVQQDKCSMKVCKDSCVFGAWIAKKIESKIISPKKILDIGTGSGLLSLMLAQKASANIDAVEINNNAFNQANENFNASPWNERLQAFHADIKKWKSGTTYDLIISNPPFFENDLKPDEIDKNIARHDEGLKLIDLIQSIKQHINSNGYFAILLPFHRVQYFENLAEENNFYLLNKLLIRQTPKHEYFRGILFFSLQKKNPIINEMTIKNEAGNYTEEFSELLKDYYLAL